MKGDRGRELAALGVKVVRAFGVVELPALGLDSSVKFCVLHYFICFVEVNNTELKELKRILGDENVVFVH